LRHHTLAATIDRMRVLVVAVAALAAAPALADNTAPRVVIISVDGLRADAIKKDVMPRHVQFAAEGTTARTASTISKPLTLPSHASMLSGFDVDDHGLSWNSYRADRGHIRVPTIFTAAHAKGLTTAMIVGKDKLRHLATPGAVDHFEIPRKSSCTGVAASAVAHFKRSQPHLMFVHFADPDDAGHSSGWGSRDYARALATVDRCLGVLVDAIDASPLGAATLIIVTADHGGEGHSHSDGGSDVVRRIPWLARGPRIEARSIITDPVDTFDTAATAFAMLNLVRTPKMRGTTRLRRP
jgi:predicted AlkP superfamily pyrophosphatase or phosphodiesterase